MNALVNILIDEHNAAPRPRFHADCIRVDACSTLPTFQPPRYRVWLSIPGYNVGVVSFDDREMAEEAAIGALFCGAEFVTIDWIDCRTWRQEVWAEVQS